MKKCPPGQYYCTDRKKCMPIPRGYHVGRGGWLEKDKKMATVMGPITVTEMVMAMVAMVTVGMATVMVAMAVGNGRIFHKSSP